MNKRAQDAIDAVKAGNPAAADDIKAMWLEREAKRLGVDVSQVTPKRPSIPTVPELDGQGRVIRRVRIPPIEEAVIWEEWVKGEGLDG